MTPQVRRRAAVTAAAAVALGAGVVIGAGDDRGDRPRRATAPPTGTHTPAPPPAASRALAAARRLPLATRVGRLVIMRFTGHPAPSYVHRALRAGRAAGVILFRDNAPTAAALRALTRTLRRAGGPDVIVCTDQEGGAVRTLLWAQPHAGQAALSSPADAGRAARAAARDLRAGGVNVTLAPVVDVAARGASVVRGRAFPGDSRAVARFTRAAVRGYSGRGVAPVAKHFPGIGAAGTNTDDAAVTLARSPAELLAEELPPFEAAIAAGVPAVMVGHALYPALDDRNIASQSREIVERLLRGRLGFRGVVVTDSLEAEAVRSRSGPGQAAVRSVSAGVDLVLTTEPGGHLRVVRALLSRARRSRAFRERVTQAAARVIELQSSFSSQ